MENEEKKESIAIIYHANCLDGFTAAWAVTKGLEAREETCSFVLVPYNYDEGFDKVYVYAQNCDKIYIVDFSFPMGVLKGLSQFCNVIMLDHHLTAFKTIADFDPAECGDSYRYEEKNLFIHLDNLHSGALLAWEHFFPFHSTRQPTPKLISYVQDNDLWWHKLPASKAINKFLAIQTQSLKTWDSLAKAFEIPSLFTTLKNRGVCIEAYHKKLVAQAISTCQEISIDGAIGLVAHASYDLINDVGSELAAISGTYGAIVIQQIDCHKISLRSCGDYDVAALAQKYEGGGHKNAASFFVKLTNYDYQRLTLTMEKE